MRDPFARTRRIHHWLRVVPNKWNSAPPVRVQKCNQRLFMRRVYRSGLDTYAKAHNKPLQRILRIRRKYYEDTFGKAIANEKIKALNMWHKRRGVVYAICHPNHKKIYVGETVNYCFDRFANSASSHMAHARKLVRNLNALVLTGASVKALYKCWYGKIDGEESTPLHRAIASTGYKKWIVIPLEFIDVDKPYIHLGRGQGQCGKMCYQPRFGLHSCDDKSSRKRKHTSSSSACDFHGNFCYTKFTRKSKAQEKLWTNRLQCWAPKGFNNQHSHGIRYKRFHVHPRPFCRRLGLRPDGSEWIHKINTRRFASRDWYRRIRHAVIAHLKGRLVDTFVSDQQYAPGTLVNVIYFLEVTPRIDLVSTLLVDDQNALLNSADYHDLNDALDLFYELLLASRADRFPQRLDLDVPRPKTGTREIIVLGFNSTVCDRLIFAAAVRHPCVRDAIPAHAREFIRIPKVVFKYADSIGLLLDNSATVFSKLTFDEIVAISEGTCSCGRPEFQPFVHERLGHVCTCDPRVFQRDTLIAACSYGRKHRLKFVNGEDEGGIGLQLDGAVAEYVKKNVEAWAHAHPNEPALDLAQYRIRLIEQISLARIRPDMHNGRLADVPADHPASQLSIGDAEMDFIRWFRKHFVITSADKASQDFAVVCIKQYAKWIVQELTLGGAYVRVHDKTPAQVLRNQASYIRHRSRSGLHCTAGERKLATFKALVKYHKEDPSKMARFIAASSKICLTRVAKRFSFWFRHLVPKFESLWTAELRRAHALDATIPVLSHSFVLKNAIPIAHMFRSLNSDFAKSQRGNFLISTYDFSTLYTTLPHELIFKAFDYLFECCFSNLPNGVAGPHRYSHMAYNERAAVDTVEFILGKPTNPPKGMRYITLAQLKEYFRFLIQNTYVMAGTDGLFHQIVGIPMGTNPAVFIANYFLFYWELLFLRRLIDWGKFDVVRHILRIRRYIDDLIRAAPQHSTVDFDSMLVHEDFSFPDHPDEPAGLYPRLITCNVEQQPSRSGHFLDIAYRFNERKSRWETTIYEKRNDPKFAKLTFYRYPNIASHLSITCKYNVVTSQCYRYFLMCSRMTDAIYFIAKLIHCLHMERFYSLPRLWEHLERAVACFIPLWREHSVKRFMRRAKSRVNRMIRYND